MVQASLRRQGIVVGKIKKQKLGGGGNVSEKDVALFTRQMATMMKAGVPLVEALDSVGGASGNYVYLQATIQIKAEVDDAVEALSSLMEPIIMVVLGTLIGGMVVAMYLPIFKLGGAV